MHCTLKGINEILHLDSVLERWPSQAERDEMKAEAPPNSFFHDCVGYIHFRNFALPSIPDDLKGLSDYDIRNSGYSCQSMFVTDWRNRIRFTSHGWSAGMTHAQILNAEEVSRSFKPLDLHLELC